MSNKPKKISIRYSHEESPVSNDDRCQDQEVIRDIFHLLANHGYYADFQNDDAIRKEYLQIYIREGTIDWNEIKLRKSVEKEVINLLTKEGNSLPVQGIDTEGHKIRLTILCDLDSTKP